MQEKENRRSQLRLWPLLFVVIIATFCLAFTGPIMKGRTRVAQVAGDGPITQIVDEENPLASPADIEQAADSEDEVTKPRITIAGISINARRAIAIFSTGVVAVAGALLYLLKRSDEEPEEFVLDKSRYEDEALRTNSTGNNVPLA